MIKHFCDRCGQESVDSVHTIDEKFAERTKFRLRAIFETVFEPAPCGSLGLCSDRVQSADICLGCASLMLKRLSDKIDPPIL